MRNLKLWFAEEITEFSLVLHDKAKMHHLMWCMNWSVAFALFYTKYPLCSCFNSVSFYRIISEVTDSEYNLWKEIIYEMQPQENICTPDIKISSES